MDDTPSQRQRMLDGDLYIADDPDLAAENRRAVRLMQAFNGSSVDEDHRAVLEELLGELGEGTEIRPPLYASASAATETDRHAGRAAASRWGRAARRPSCGVSCG